MAVGVTIACAVIAFPVAFYMARVASPRMRGILVVALVVPLWTSYLIKAYSWRLILAEDGVMNWLLEPLGLKGPGYGELAVLIVMTYLWLPFMVLPFSPAWTGTRTRCSRRRPTSADGRGRIPEGRPAPRHAGRRRRFDTSRSRSPSATTSP